MQFISNLANVLAGQQKIDVGKSKSNVYVKSGLQVLQVFSNMSHWAKEHLQNGPELFLKIWK